MTDNLIGKRVRATLGENVLVGTVRQSHPTVWTLLEVSDHAEEMAIDPHVWTIEPLPDPLPTTPYSLVVPPADDPSSFPYVLVPFVNTAGEGSSWWSGATKGREETVAAMVRDHGWRVIPGPAENS